MANSYPIYIKNISADNSNLVVKWTLVLLVLNWISHWLFLDEMAIANMFLYGLGIVGFLLGFLKSTEPKIILKIDLKGLYYCHRWGSLFCPWSNVQRMDIPRVTGLGPSYEFDFIGVKFKDEEEFYQNIPLRLAAKLLTEQRPLWLTAVQHSCRSGDCKPELYSDAVEHKLTNGTPFKGLIAMFVHRYEVLAQLLGFHFYIPTNNCEEPTHKLLNLLKEVKKESDRLDFNPLP